MLAASFKILLHNLDEFVRAIGPFGTARGMKDMFADVILDQFRHEAVHRPPDRCDEVQDFGAWRRTDGPFDGLHLPFQATDAGNQLGFVLGKMAHNIGGYPILERHATHRILEGAARRRHRQNSIEDTETKFPAISRVRQLFPRSGTLHVSPSLGTAFAVSTALNVAIRDRGGSLVSNRGLPSSMKSRSGH